MARKARNASKLTSTDVAAKIGVKDGYISQIETGKRSVTIERAREIAALYGKSVDEIFKPVRYAVRDDEGGDQDESTVLGG